MGGNKSQNKSYFSFLAIFWFKKSRKGGDDSWDDTMKAYKVYPSDQDRAGRWADPRIDRKASAYIDDRTNKWSSVEGLMEQDIYEQILTRSNVLDVIRFKTVCKSWYSLISDSRFIKNHLNHHTHNNDRTRRRIIMSKWSSVPHCQLSNDAWFYNFHGTSKLLGTCNGLVCIFTFYSQLLVVNPSTRQVIKFSAPRIPRIVKTLSLLCWGFGYDSDIDDYKVILGVVIDEYHTSFQMLTLKTKVWKFIGQVDYTVISNVGILCNDALHWFMMDEEEENLVIISFHLYREEFKEIPQPDDAMYQPNTDFDLDDPNIDLGIMDECLGIIIYDKHIKNLWIMKNYNVKRSWEVVGHDCGIKSEAIHCLTELKRGIPYERSLGHDVVFYNAREFVGAPIFVQSLVSPHFYNHNLKKHKRKRSAKALVPVP